MIWTALPLGQTLETIYGRKFIFQFEGTEHECQFGASSPRLMLMAEHAWPIGVSDTEHRNLWSFRQHVFWDREAKKGDEVPKPPGKPVSFWIKNLEWDDARVLRLAHHLNFYMNYYDSKSPAIRIHSKKTTAANPQTRFMYETFPQKIRSQALEDDLLHFWAAARHGDAGRRFVYYYRIVEYASFTYIDREARQKIRRMLSLPHAYADIAALTEQVISTAIGAKQIDDIPRINALLTETADPAFVWREIENNRADFESKVAFDGGFTLDPLIDKNTDKAAFNNKMLLEFAKSARNIRNHLSHGRDKGTQMSITPTEANSRRLEPWVSALAVVAGEVIISKELFP